MIIYPLCQKRVRREQVHSLPAESLHHKEQFAVALPKSHEENL